MAGNYYIMSDIGAGTGATNATVWNGWATAQSTVATGTIWINWNSSTASITVASAATQGYRAPAKTPDEIEIERVEMARRQAAWCAAAAVRMKAAAAWCAAAAVRMKAAAAAAAKAAVRMKAAGAAAAKAAALLTENLKPAQREEYERCKSFCVTGASGVKFRIRQGTYGNVDELDAAGNVVAHYCGYLPDCPESDVMLGQKLMLEHAETELEYRRTANRTAVRR